MAGPTSTSRPPLGCMVSAVSRPVRGLSLYQPRCDDSRDTGLSPSSGMRDRFEIEQGTDDPAPGVRGSAPIGQTGAGLIGHTVVDRGVSFEDHLGRDARERPVHPILGVCGDQPPILMDGPRGEGPFGPPCSLRTPRSRCGSGPLAAAALREDRHHGPRWPRPGGRLHAPACT
jgi:hypothetical protein